MPNWDVCLPWGRVSLCPHKQLSKPGSFGQRGVFKPFDTSLLYFTRWILHHRFISGTYFFGAGPCPPSVLHGDPSSVFQQRLAWSHFNSVEHIWIQFNQFKFTRSPWNSLKLTPNPFKANPRRIKMKNICCMEGGIG